MVVKLSNEACDNGNINWDDNFEWFCDFLKEELIECNVFDGVRSKKIEEALDYIKSNGNYARSYAKGDISDDEVEIIKLAYVDDDLYSYLEDAVAEFYLNNKELIPYEKEILFTGNGKRGEINILL